MLRDAGYWSRCQPAVKKQTTVVTVLYVGEFGRGARRVRFQSALQTPKRVSLNIFPFSQAFFCFVA